MCSCIKVQPQKSSRIFIFVLNFIFLYAIFHHFYERIKINWHDSITKNRKEQLHDSKEVFSERLSCHEEAEPKAD